jgi:hypothetical protein
MYALTNVVGHRVQLCDQQLWMLATVAGKSNAVFSDQLLKLLGAASHLKTPIYAGIAGCTSQSRW